MANHKQRLAFYLSLSHRRRQIVRHVAQHLDNIEIAARLYIVPGAVANHLTVIYLKLQETGYCPDCGHYKRAALVGFFGDFFQDYPEIAEAEESLWRVREETQDTI